MSANNPFVFSAATDLAVDEVLDYYIEDFNYSRFIQSNRNVFLLGERGSGKTMTLLYNSLGTQKRQAERAGVGADLRRIGIYVPCNTPLTHRREYELLEDHKAGILSEHLFVLSIAAGLIMTLENAEALLGDIPNDELVDEFEAVMAVDLDGAGAFLTRARRFIEAENQRTNLAINRAEEDFYSSAHSFSTLLMPLLAIASRIPALADTHFMLMLDDANYLNPHQSASLNSWIAYRDHSQFSFKVATPKASQPAHITLTGGAILEGHDYTVVDLEKPLHNEHSDFGRLAEKIVARRLERIDCDSSPREFFPQSPTAEAQLQECKEQAGVLAKKKYPEGSPKQISDYVYKYYRVLYFRRRPKANLPVYSGFEMIKYLSTGVVRCLLEPCYWMYDKAVSTAQQSGEASDSIQSIDPTIQNAVIMELSERAWGQLEAGLNHKFAGCTEEQARQIRNLFEGLARHFRERLLADCSEPRATSFTVSGKSDADRRALEELLTIARRARLLYVRTGTAKEAGSREPYYVPTRMLWPIRGLDPQGQHARVSLKARDLMAVARGEPSPWTRGDPGANDEPETGTLFDVS